MKPDKLAAGGVLGLGFWLGLEGEVTSGAWWSLMLESSSAHLRAVGSIAEAWS